MKKYIKNYLTQLKHHLKEDEPQFFSNITNKQIKITLIYFFKNLCYIMLYKIADIYLYKFLYFHSNKSNKRLNKYQIKIQKKNNPYTPNHMQYKKNQMKTEQN